MMNKIKLKENLTPKAAVCVRQQHRVSSHLSFPHAPICSTSRLFPLLHPSRPLLKYVFPAPHRRPSSANKVPPLLLHHFFLPRPKTSPPPMLDAECHSRLSLIELRSLWCHSCCSGCRCRRHREAHCLPSSPTNGTVFYERRKNIIYLLVIFLLFSSFPPAAAARPRHLQPDVSSYLLYFI